MTTMHTVKKTRKTYRAIKGELGNWFATVTWSDGSREDLPCCHDRFHDGHTYHQPPEWWSAGFAPDLPRVHQLVEELKNKKRVAVTKDDWTDYPSVKRTGYVGIFDIADVVCDADGLRFRFTGRYRKQ